MSSAQKVQTRHILTNAMMSVIQVVLASAVLFILYKFLLNTIGVEQLGIWSLVLATTSVMQVSNLGLSGSVVKFVAKYAAHEDHRQVAAVIQTALVSLATMVGIALLIGYPVIKYTLSIIMDLASFEKADQILPIALLSLWLMTVSGIIQSGFDGLQRIYIRNLIVIGGSVLYAFLCFLLTPKNGLLGLAYAQLINALLMSTVSWCLIRKYQPQIPIIPYRWNKNIFKEIIGYGINFQITTSLTLFYDPVTKALLSRFSGLSMVGYYEMATKLVQQVQSILMAANQVMVPVIADLKEVAITRIRPVFLKSYELMQYLALPIFSLLIISVPLISQIWIGHYEETFIIIAILLSIGRFVNTMRSPAYFTYLGIGALRWNAISHIVIFILNCILGCLFSKSFSGYGVIVALVIAIITGSLINLLSYYIRERIPLRKLLPKHNGYLLLLCSSVAALVYVLHGHFSHIWGAFLSSTFMIVVGILTILIPVLANPMRNIAASYVISTYFKKRIDENNIISRNHELS